MLRKRWRMWILSLDELTFRLIHLRVKPTVLVIVERRRKKYKNKYRKWQLKTHSNKFSFKQIICSHIQKVIFRLILRKMSIFILLRKRVILFNFSCSCLQMIKAELTSAVTFVKLGGDKKQKYSGGFLNSFTSSPPRSSSSTVLGSWLCLCDGSFNLLTFSVSSLQVTLCFCLEQELDMSVFFGIPHRHFYVLDLSD